MITSRLCVDAAVLALLVATAALVVRAQVTGTWNTHHQVYSIRDKHSITCDGSAVYIYGGRGEGARELNTLFYMNTTLATTPGASPWDQIFHNGGGPVEYNSAMHRFGDIVYLWGGTHQGRLTNKMWKYHVVNREWSSVAPEGSLIPTPRQRFFSVTRHDTFVVFCGFLEDRLSNQVWEFNITTQRWRLAHDGSSPQPAPLVRYDPCCVIDKTIDYSYCYGGTGDPGDFKDMWGFDHTTDTWELLSDGPTAMLPRRLAHCALTRDRQSVIVYSGFESTLAFFVADGGMYRYNVATKQYSLHEQNPVPTPRDGGKMCTTNEGTFLFGGEDVTGRINDVWMLNETTYTMELLSDTYKRPAPRMGHSAALVGTHMFIAFGSGDNAAGYNDIWRLDMQTRLWKEMKTTPGGESITHVVAPPPREGACATAIGESIFFFGGISSSGYLADFYSFSENAGWAPVSQTHPPEPTAYAACASRNKTFIMIGGEKSPRGSARSWVYVYELRTSVWYAVSFIDYPTAPKFPRSHPSMVTTTNDDLLILNGFGNASFEDIGPLNDRFRLSWHRFDPALNHYNLSSSPRDSIIPDGLTNRYIARGFAATAGIGNIAIICGGGTAFAGGTGGAFPAPPGSSCYQYNGNTGTNTILAEQPAIDTFGATALYFRNVMYMFGGRLFGRSVTRLERVDMLQVYTVDAGAICKEGSTSDSGCMHCSHGAHNPVASQTITNQNVCKIAAPGTYSHNPAAKSQLCPAGSYSKISGVSSSDFCVFCPAGTFQDLEGQTECKPCINACGIGQRTDAAAPAKDANFSWYEIQPNELNIPTDNLPENVYWSHVGAGIGLFFFTFIAVGLRWDFEAHYLGKEPHIVNKIYQEYMEKYDTDDGNDFTEIWRGLPFAYCRFALLDVFLNHCDPRDVSLHEDTKKALDEKLYYDIDVEIPRFDFNGDGYLTEQGFKELVIYLIRTKTLPPVRKTSEARGGFRAAIFAGGFAFFDNQFGGAWTLAPTSSRPVHRLRATETSGLVRFGYLFLAFVFCLFLCWSFLFSNFSETRATIPLVISKGGFKSDVIIVHESIGGTEHESDCVRTPGTYDCSPVIEEGIRVSPMESLNVSGAPLLSCAFNLVEKKCTLTWRCPKCTFETDRKVTVRLNTAPRTFANSIKATVSVTSGIPQWEGRGDFSNNDELGEEQASQVVASLIPAQEGVVFKGFPASKVDVALNPSEFTSFTNSLMQQSFRQTGYHLDTRAVVPGHVTNEFGFNNHFGTPLEVSFTANDVVLKIDRLAKQSVADFLSSLLGAASGLSGLFLLFLTTWYGELKQEFNNDCTRNWESEAARQTRIQKYRKQYYEEQSEGKYHNIPDFYTIEGAIGVGAGQSAVSWPSEDGSKKDYARKENSDGNAPAADDTKDGMLVEDMSGHESQDEI